ncbi:MAG: tetratricopeptide repeat protein [Candidatus Omnitrophica bacterium]|nr:tetratricopeptide repeat protein [Candidatus Omnitrophota bacterium]MDD5670594.1 tetratricopeptide repeat protein [Candidatus Omnitrophota bacterium]
MQKLTLILCIVLVWGLVIAPCVTAEKDDSKSSAMQELKDLYSRGTEYLESEDYDEAIEIFLQILRQQPNMPQIYNLLGIAYLKQGESRELAIDSFRKATEIKPDFAEAYFNLATTYAESGDDMNLAIENFNKVINLDPKNYRAYFDLGWIVLMEKNDMEEARRLFQKTIEIAPKFAQAYFGLGVAYIQLKQTAMVLQPISVLRSMNEEELALKLEQMMKGEEGWMPGGGGEGENGAVY